MAADGGRMKLQALGAVLAAPLLITGSLVVGATPQDQGDDELRAMVELQALELAELRLEVAETQDLLALTTTYLEAQAKAAKSLEATLKQAESLGFTAGINPNSRETLLSGWRAYLGDQQAGVPRLNEPEPADKPKAKR